MLQQQMVSINLPSLLALGFLVGIVLLIIGYRERGDFQRRNRFIGSGLSIIGIMTLLTPLSWFLYFAYIYGTVIMTSGDIAIFAMLAFIGGILAGVGLIIAQNR
jgi:hypothetical protein